MLIDAFWNDRRIPSFGIVRYDLSGSQSADQPEDRPESQPLDQSGRDYQKGQFADQPGGRPAGQPDGPNPSCRSP
jgi:hypothetical protein